MKIPSPGDVYTKDGVQIDVEYIEFGDVYYRKWPKGVKIQSMLENCRRMPIAEFIEKVKDATLVNPPNA